MTRLPAKSPRQDAKAVIEAWVVLDDSSGMCFWCDSEDAAYARAAIQPARRRIVKLTSAPPTAPDGRVKALERALRMALRLIRACELEKDAPNMVAEIKASLTPAKKGRVKP